MIELIVHNAVYRAEEKRLEIVFALVDYDVLDSTTTVVDQASGKVLSTNTQSTKNVNQAFGETVYCDDAAGHVHDPKVCAKAHPDFPAKKAKLDSKLADWKTKIPPVSMTPIDRKIQ